ncbi:homeobox-like protein HDP1 isoform X1 [Helicoverpa armigera]|uniref:homeobox-like protein HDP1 isoform X1 n=2 Tax=Helicoverpa armigera TaxID=29058 RepID=UPI003082E2C1
MTSKQEFNCVFCKDVFENKEDLQEHFRKHGDPKYKNRFEVDPQASDEKSREKAELVSCDVCSQVFPTISKAITHKHKVHPDHDAKYFCPWCGKLFTMKHLYNVHVQASHATQEKIEEKCFRCDSCSVDFFIPSAMINHNKFFHRQDTDLPDVGHSKKIKYYQQEIVPIYYCAFCGEEYENKVNLIKHISDDHGDENQTPEEVLKCPMCEAVFYHLDAYEIHLTFHSSEDMYSINNSQFGDLLDYSLETLPPIIEKVTNLEPEDTDAESTLNAVGIEKFLELAMDQSDETSPVKVKKHKKHKKSKKSAITLDEFLSMNQDVFGEGLDFQGIEEVPTRVVKKQLKNNKKSINSVVTSAELDKLKKAGIVVKRKVERVPLNKSIKIVSSMPIKSALHKPVNKINKVREIETSSAVLTKLMNQSNNQIKIVKKVIPNTSVSDPSKTNDDVSPEKTEEIESHVEENKIDANQKIEEHNSPIPKIDDDEKDLPSPNSKLLSVTDPAVDRFSQSNVDSNVVEDTENTDNSQKIKEISEIQNNSPHHSPKPVQNETCQEIANGEDTEQDNNGSEKFDSDTELENKSEAQNNVNDDKIVDSRRVPINDNRSQNNVLSSSASSLSTLKHLGHLTVKSISTNQIKNDILTEPTTDEKIMVKNCQSSNSDSKKETSEPPLGTDKLNVTKQKNIVEKDPTMDALKALGKNITIKSLSSKRNIDASDHEDDEIDECEPTTNNLKSADLGGNKNITIKKMKVETNEPTPNKTRNLPNQDRKCNPGKQVVGQKILNNVPGAVTNEKSDNSISTSNANILKRLTNITTKPIVNKANSPSPPIKQGNVAKKVVETEKQQEEIIEIFDIDDSEDEDDVGSKPQHSENSMKSMDALKNLSKNITVKSLNQQSVKQNVKTENNIKLEKEDSNSQNTFKSQNNINDRINMQNRSTGVQNVLQGLCKNITIKSRNTSSSQFVQSEENITQESKVFEDDDDVGSDISDNVEITELEEDFDDSEDNSEMPEKTNENMNNPIIESPHDSGSDNEHFDEDIHDFETDIKVSTVQKSNKTMNSTINSVCFNNLKNINKNITIKSISKNPASDDISKQANDSQETSRIQNKTIPTKIFNKVGQESANDNISVNRISKISTQPLNKRMSAMNEVSTVNKEVTVKTIQTKTMIQEITTTVTKTIKTVNQTMKQEVRNTSFQSNKPIAAQRIQGMKPSQSTNFQGVVIRHAPPSVGVRATHIRPANTVVRPSKQIVPARPRMNLARPNNSARPSNPTMAIGTKVIPAPTPNKPPVIGKPLKVSPGAMASGTAKRLNTEDVSGPFSCFKKPKESLIPVSDIPTFGNSDVTAFTSASHTSSSNFTSTTKVVKGNSVVSAKQVKSEVNASSQQISRLNNATGMKIMTSQQKQSQVHEKSESSPMKRTTLEAIQRLQKQGLLVKKPRTDVNEDNEGSDHDSDDNVGNCPTEEQDA